MQIGVMTDLIGNGKIIGMQYKWEFLLVTCCKLLTIIFVANSFRILYDDSRLEYKRGSKTGMHRFF